LFALSAHPAQSAFILPKLLLVLLRLSSFAQEHLVPLLLEVLALLEAPFHVLFVGDECLLRKSLPLQLAEVLLVILVFDVPDLVRLLLCICNLLRCSIHLVLEHSDAISQKRAVSLDLAVDGSDLAG